MEGYNHKEIEKKWQEKWEEQGIHHVPDSVPGKENFYQLVEFTYPSGDLHVGHWYAFAVPDIFARYKKMQGFNVLYPMGFDAFGLPAENAAIKLGTDPKVWTYQQMDRMRDQFRTMGAIFPWEREVVSCDPSYYKWTQWMFNEFLKKDLVYRAVTQVNWCPKDQTILANEQVASGLCDRCGAEVEQKNQEQWMLRITKYADRLIDDLDKLNWPEEIKASQKNWIGRSEGSEISFEIKQEKTRFVLLHGYEGSSENNFFPWLKKELEERGHEVICPDLPDSDDPNVYNQLDFVLNTISFDENTVLVGHSLGGIVSLKILEKLSFKVKKTILVGCYAENRFLDEDFSPDAFDWKFDVEKITKNGGELILLRDLKDCSVPQDNTLALHKIIGGQLFDYVAEEPHFLADIEPVILKHCLDVVNVFTTRADTLFGVTYVVLAPEHSLVQTLLSQVENKDEVEAYVAETKKKSELDRQQEKMKTGVELKGVKVVNPANGAVVPVWIADYVLAGYGTGAVMAVPAHDERDFEFAQKYNLPIKEVIESLDINTGPHNDAFRAGLDIIPRENVLCIVKHPTDDQYLCVAWKKVTWNGFVTGGIESGKTIEETAIAEIREETGYQNLRIGTIFDSRVHALFYHVGKNVNRHAHYTIVEVLLSDLEQVERSEEEVAIHSLVWLPKEKVLDFLTRPDMKSAWNIYQGQKGCKTDDGELVNSGDFSGLISTEARKKITEHVGGKLVSTYRLRDWGISRQRFWGCPIPIVYDPEGKAHAIPDEHLPWILPTDVDHTPDGTAPLARSKELLERTEKIFGKGWRPEVETMDTFVDSSWYFYRYLDNKNDSEFASGEKMKSWMPIDLYMGGAEHTTMHLLYSRFWVKALYDLGLVKDDEAYTVRRNRGIILGIGGVKMSKSKPETVINPDEIVDRLGTDTVRMYLAFMGPYGVTTNYPWDPNGVVGVRRFLERVSKIARRVRDINIGKAKDYEYVSTIKNSIAKTIVKVGKDIEDFKFNTAISSMMICLNEMENAPELSVIDFEDFIKLLAPFAPHITEELWINVLNEKESIHISNWPKYDPALIVDDEVTIVIQVNGKVRGSIIVPLDSIEADVKAKAESEESVKKHLTGEPKKVIYVKNKLISFVL